MCFVDGENFAIRGQEVTATSGITLVSGIYFERDVFLWSPGKQPIDLILHKRSYGSYSHSIRSYYYTSVVGDAARVDSMKDRLCELGVQSEVFKKAQKHQKAKGVDIALARDVLSNAFRHNYDVAFLFAGDGDYVPLVEEVKRLGKIVCIVFFETSGLNPILKLAADFFLPLEDAFIESWQTFESGHREKHEES